MKFILTLFLCLSVMGVANASDLYWVSFNGDDGEGSFLMQIDADGHIVENAVVVATESQLGGDCDCGTAMAYNPAHSKLFLFSSNEDSVSDVFRVTIDPNTMATLSIKRLALNLDDDPIAVTQYSSPFFLAGQQVNADEVLRGYSLNSKGAFSGSSKRIAPRNEGDIQSFNVTPDGWFSIIESNPADFDRIYVQRLNDSTGAPQGDPVVAISGDDIDALDMSNILSNGKRLLVYLNDSDNRIEGVFVNGITGERAGSSFIIATDVDPEEEDHGVAVDPKGRFAIFTREISSCNDDGVFFVSLSPNGTPGNEIELAGCAFHTAFGVGDDLMNVDVLGVSPY